MDMIEFNKAFQNGHLNKIHIDFIVDENKKLTQSLIAAKEALLMLRNESYRRTNDGAKLIDEALDHIRKP